MVPLRRIVVFGSHGIEGRWPGQPALRVPRGPALRLEALARVAQVLERRRGVFVERKPAGLAIHDRNVPSSELNSWRRERDLWLREQELNGLERIAGKRVLELRPRGAHKGRVAETLPLEAGAPRPDASLVAMGDDRTDEDLFRAVRGRGLSVLVGRPRRTTLAEERLPSPLAVQRFLIRLAELS
jgi:trehalose-phosphatase